MNINFDEMTPEKADFYARCYVNGMRMHSASKKLEPAHGEFSSRFITHPWARESISEGWDRELRSHLILKCKLAYMRKSNPGDVESLMPPRDWVDAAKHNAVRYRSAAEWQKANLPKSVGLMAMVRALAKKSGIDPDTGEITDAAE